MSTIVDGGVLLAKPWTDKIDPTGWWMSEKLDGIRAVWDPVKRQLLSRNGKKFYAPAWYLRALPDVALDGELFIGRGKFQETVSIVRSQQEPAGWNKVEYRVFDLYPTMNILLPLRFEFRQKQLAKEIEDEGFVTQVKQVLCKGYKHLTSHADKIHARGGEGVMLRAPQSLYEKKRSSTLLKVKRFHDLEATVIGVVPGKGKHKGRMGALDCKARTSKNYGTQIDLTRPVTFQVGTGFTDEERERKNWLRARITVRYQELTNDGIPRFPVFITERDYE